MRKQDHEIHGYDLYNTFKRDPVKDDGYIIFVCIIGAVLAFVAFAGIERVFNVLVQFIGGIVSNL